jgi:hypothetical protein
MATASHAAELDYGRNAVQLQPTARVESEMRMAKRQPKSKPTWADVKANLASFDRRALLTVLQNLYAADPGTRAFLHARFDLGKDPLQPYKKTIDRWLWPDVFRGQETSVSRAKRAITDYKKAIGDSEGLAELTVFYCERAVGFCRDVGLQDAAYFQALVRMFGQALNTTANLTANVQSEVLTRLDRVRSIGHEFGYGVGDDMDVLLSEFVPSFQHRSVPDGDRRREGRRGGTSSPETDYIQRQAKLEGVEESRLGLPRSPPSEGLHLESCHESKISPADRGRCETVGRFV